MVSTSPSSISTPLPSRSVPSVSALKASGGMIECSPTTEASTRSRSKLKSAWRGWYAFHSVNEGMENLLASGRVYRELEGTGAGEPGHDLYYIMSLTAIAKDLRPCKLKCIPRAVAAAF